MRTWQLQKSRIRFGLFAVESAGIRATGRRAVGAFAVAPSILILDTMPTEWFLWVVLSIAALVASTLAAVAGFGGAAVLLPALVLAFGVRAAVPILTVAQLVGNGARVWFNRQDLNLRVVGWFSFGGVPMALLGGYVFANAPISALTRLLGAFLLLVVIWRHLRASRSRSFPAPMFAAIGAAGSFLSALLGSVGPLIAPFYLAYGLVKGAYIGTEALSTVVMHVTKLVAYQRTAVLAPSGVFIGLALGPWMILGSFLGKHIVDRLPERVFIMIIEGVLLIAGTMFLVRG